MWEFMEFSNFPINKAILARKFGEHVHKHADNKMISALFGCLPNKSPGKLEVVVLSIQRSYCRREGGPKLDTQPISTTTPTVCHMLFSTSINHSLIFNIS